ncbi:MAG: Asp-tRNA(Asn)/Glu-tRNA(Gln) amidotransferase subunit GatB [Armatimonadota bacterium]|nr:Asp-tRNA(Asn)/Glu-tRNA(Gln) amidotransferase subunit GatB [Armatimonadota bacterium]MDR7452077.1 Asp-tRNA(Asn)/Glu-tRNA(Gln) amidotransferase subunit GatB [Armatimonadota bacterium]MDR7466539.1 Asp-tRNA(Asn)/Glu-tRNA(Gln) amidotransferase subunit GatB [Armatimonadota bacterium]MDR7493261.1 Asp-tRNA(Asn)/Glu-tRNA(Gln) amidotransferase subunit GatB [Armatimonadota bacterium]MDR7499846.1 Asp-tRNA(Asn)/Glu-tRNA(Gln) amidotransferase subunit GatB [Armatimonadota bacterium]
MSARPAVELETVIGLEIHVQLLTQSKMFCACPTTFGAPPNTQVCPVCLGLPGALPVLNGRAVELGVRTAVALNCTVHPESRFHRKNYYYPDLPKNYQITQYQYLVHPPLASGGWMEIAAEGGRRRVGIRRVHLEEDTGRLVHPAHGRYSLVDYNRSGVPLMEIVTDPDLHTPTEARRFLAALRALLQAIGVSSGRMEEGSLRVDANISLRRPGEALGTRTEVKNMNSLRSVERALLYEVARQRELLAAGRIVEQETRHWDEDRGVTFASRTKEEAQDYRYFPEPDLVPVVVPRTAAEAVALGVTGITPVEEVRRSLPELPEQRRGRYLRDYGLSAQDADLIVSSAGMAAFFEEVVRRFPQPRTVSHWLVGEITAYLNAQGKELEDLPIGPDHLAELLDLIETGTISGRTAKELLPDMLTTGSRPGELVRSRGLGQISDREALRAVVEEVLREHPAPVADVRAGKARAMAFLVGQVMKKTRGRANPEMVTALLREHLEQQ